MTTTINRPGTDTDTDLDAAFRDITDTNDQTDDGAGEHDLFSHYASKEAIVRAETQGVKIVALCGKKWKPTRNPAKFPVCPDCEVVFMQMRNE